jgi:hypothetical protein
VFASTWNVGGVTPSDGLDLEDWLDTRANAYDIYVLGYPPAYLYIQLAQPVNERLAHAYPAD